MSIPKDQTATASLSVSVPWPPSAFTNGMIINKSNGRVAVAVLLENFISNFWGEDDTGMTGLSFAIDNPRRGAAMPHLMCVTCACWLKNL